MQYPKKIRNFNAFLDGESYLGRALEASLPKVTLQTAAHRGAGMDGPVAIDLGTEAMQASVTLAEFAPAALKLLGARRRMVLRPVTKRDTDPSFGAIVATLGGLWGSVDPDALKPGSDSHVKLMLEVDYFRLEIDGDEIWEIEPTAQKRVVDGVDQLAGLRAAMGLLA